MDLTSAKFLIFILVAVVGYYLIPKKWQWKWLLLFSYLYYTASSVKIAVFLLFTTATTYGCALWMEAVDRKALSKKETTRRKKTAAGVALLLNFGVLAVLKYTNFTIENINLLFHAKLQAVNFLLPLGISFYTFQSMGYLLDVYWKKITPERNFLRFALFVSFFPQIMQGPIGRFHHLAEQLYAEHGFDIDSIVRGMERMLWGFFKKMVLADNAAVFVNAIFDDYTNHPGLAAFGVLAYSIQLYGDFSGGMDVVLGIASMFGIEMEENFKRPYFAVSITDFWHRWHITLGTWMKDYVFYPLSLSKGMSKFGKFARKKFGKTIGRGLPVCIANIIVFFLVGVWHGAAWKYIAYGLYNGIIIGASGMLLPTYRQCKQRLHINDKGKAWHVFQILRTFLLVNISWFFDRADTVGQALTMMKNAVTHFQPEQLLTIAVGNSKNTSYAVFFIGVLLAGCVILLLAGILQERGCKLHDMLSACPIPVRMAIYLMFLFALPALGQMPAASGGFIYAQF